MKRVLVLEDDETNRFLMQVLLSKMGYAVETTDNAMDFQRMLEARFYDLSLMDIVLPDASGIDVIRQVRNNLAGCGDIPIIAVSGRVFKEEIRECMEAGADCFVSKPFTKKDMQQALDQVLSGEKYKKYKEHRMGKREVSQDLSLSREEAASLMTQIAEGMAKGNMMFRHGQESLELHPGPVVDLDIEAVQKKGKEKIRIELGWKTAAKGERSGSFSIAAWAGPGGE